VSSRRAINSSDTNKPKLFHGHPPSCSHSSPAGGLGAGAASWLALRREDVPAPLAVQLDDFLHFDPARCLGPALLGNAAFQLREMNPLKLVATSRNGRSSEVLKSGSAADNFAPSILVGARRRRDLNLSC
jgi:hypothetical protein